MGGARAYNPAGGFYFKDFEQVGDTIYYKGLVGKILRKVDGSSSGLPSRSGKTIFPEGVVHVQEYAKGERTGTTRYMSNEEINFFGDLFKSLNPSVKFRP